MWMAGLQNDWAVGEMGECVLLVGIAGRDSVDGGVRAKLANGKRCL